MRVNSFLLTALMASTADAFAPHYEKARFATSLAETLQSLGGDYANMRGSEPPAKEGYIPPPNAPLQGIGGDYGIMNEKVKMNEGDRDEHKQSQVRFELPATTAAPEDVAIAMEQTSTELVPPPPLRGIGGDYGVMNDKVSMDEPVTTATNGAESGQPQSFGPLRGLGGDYGVMNDKICMCDDMSPK